MIVIAAWGIGIIQSVDQLALVPVFTLECNWSYKIIHTKTEQIHFNHQIQLNRDVHQVFDKMSNFWNLLLKIGIVEAITKWVLKLRVFQLCHVYCGSCHKCCLSSASSRRLCYHSLCSIFYLISLAGTDFNKLWLVVIASAGLLRRLVGSDLTTIEKMTFWQHHQNQEFFGKDKFYCATPSIITLQYCFLFFNAWT